MNNSAATRRQQRQTEQRRTVRYFWFGISILVGIALGVLLGWSRPVDNANAPPESLRSDYQIDVVLMVAEAYQADHDLGAAQRRLSYLNVEDDLVRFIQEAALEAHEIGYSTNDLETMVTLSQALSQAGAGSAP